MEGQLNDMGSNPVTVVNIVLLAMFSTRLVDCRNWVVGPDQHPVSNRCHVSFFTLTMAPTPSKTLPLIPDTLDVCFPNHHLSIAELCDFTIPPITPALVSYEAATCLSSDPPNEDLLVFKTCTIPPPDWTQNVLAELKKREGWIHSIIDHRYTNSQLPLCMLPFWEKISAITTTQIEWKKAYTWITYCPGGPEYTRAMDEVKNVLATIPWGAHIPS
jgi:hypothetical protein